MGPQGKSPTPKGRAIPCPHCGKMLELRPEWRGKRGCCYSCKGIFIFPHNKRKKRAVTQDPLKAKLREILPNATESDLNRALKQLKDLNMDLQQLEHMETSRVQKLFQSDTPELSDQHSLTRATRPSSLFRSDTPLSAVDNAMLTSNNPSRRISADEFLRSLNRPEKKQNRNFIGKIKNAFRRKK